MGNSVSEQHCCGNNSSEKAAQNESNGGNIQLSTTSTITNESTDESKLKLSSMFGSSTISLSSDSSEVSVSESEVCVTGSNLDMEAAAVAAA